MADDLYHLPASPLKMGLKPNTPSVEGSRAASLPPTYTTRWDTTHYFFVELERAEAHTNNNT